MEETREFQRIPTPTNDGFDETFSFRECKLGEESRPLLASSNSELAADNSCARQKKKGKGSKRGVCSQLRKYMKRLIRSRPDEHTLIKSVIAFPIGLIISVGLHFALIEQIQLPPTTRHIIGGCLGILISLGFAVSTFMRCLIILVMPTFFGKNGRSQITAYAVLYIVSELLANHTVEKWKFRLKPVQEAIKQLDNEGFLIEQLGRVVNDAFKPIRGEFDQNFAGSDSVVQQSDKTSGKHKVAEIEARHKGRATGDTPEALENKWERKLDYQCEGIFGQAVVHCYAWMAGLQQKCMDALSIAGYILCLPLKLTVLCEIIRVMPGAIGLDCKSMEVVNPGLGETYQASRDMIQDMDKGFKVNMQYKVITPNDTLDFTGATEARKRTMYQFNSKRRAMDFVITLVKRILAFMFILMFYKSYQYENNYLSDFKFDNRYITSYFRHIDFRRKQKGKSTLLPLKKIEQTRVIYPTSITLMATEKNNLGKGTLKLLFRVVLTGIIVLMDYLLYWVLNLISKNSHIDYRQTGVQVMKIQVYGHGFISEIVRIFLVNFNIKHEIDNLTTNAGCLPDAKLTDIRQTITIFVIYGASWVFMLFEAYGLRIRRVVCAFFYRKREKKRILHMYNDMLKKRKSFLRYMRHRIRKQVKTRMLERSVGTLTAVLAQSATCCPLLARWSAARATCLVCNESKRSGFHHCETDGCPYGYCADCWIDIKMRCYACQQKSTSDTESDGSVILDESELTEDELLE